jgi:dihydroorotate dehydrogenase (NAD+) catalytic subunit
MSKTTGNLAVTLAGVSFSNPVIAASGTFGYGDELTDRSVRDAFGGIVLKGLTLRPREGNPPVRIAETPSGILNAIGLQNIGVERFLKERLPGLRKVKARVIANIAGHSIEENVEIVRALDGADRIDLYELNVSCPNVKEGGLAFGSDRTVLARLVAEVRKATTKKVMVKLSPNVTDIADMARVCEAEGADMISAINTLLGMAISVEKRRPVLANITGGLSGPAVRPVGIRAVWQIASAVKIPVVGLGGIVNSRDCLEYILAGASAVQIGTGNFVKSDLVKDIVRDLGQYCAEKGIRNMSELVGMAREDH